MLSAAIKASALALGVIVLAGGGAAFASRSGAVPRCATAQLRVSVVRGDAATSHRYWDLALFNRGSIACRLQGYPGVGLLDSNGSLLAVDVARARAQARPSVVLRSGARGFFTFSYTVGGPCGSSTFKAYGLRITPPDEYAHLLLRRPAFTVCAVRIGGPPTVSAVRRALDVKTATVSVAFVRGEQLVDVRRTGHSAADATARLITGLTRAETAAAFRTYIPAGTVVHRLSSRGGLATVDMGSRFVAGRSEEELTAEVSQLVQTLSAFAPRVQILVDGQRVERTVGGIPLARPISLSQLKTPNVPLPQAPAVRPRAPDPVTLKAQKRLIELGYLAPGDADGRFGPTTSAGVIAFQKLQRLTRSGSIDTPTATALVSATRPTPVSQGGAGKRAEILLDRQAALLIENNRVVRAISVSTGKTSTPTPPGSYRVYAKIPRWWSTPFREWLPWALPFVGGIAFHQYSVVPAYPASHGCVRQPFSVARWTYDFAEVGMPVRVLAHS